MNKIKLSKLANINMGQSPKSENYCDNEGIPFLQGNRTFGEKYPKIDIYTKQVTKLAKKGEILISVRAPVGDLNIAPVDLCIGRGLSSINSFNNNDNEFLYYCLKYNVKNILKQSSGTTYDSISKGILENFELITPKKENYIKVGKILSEIDKKIELNNKINSELETMAKTIYDYWFLQFEFPNEEGKPYKSSGGKMVWNEELKREIPEGWEVKSIFDELFVQYGFPFATNKFTTEKTDIPVVRIRDILTNTISTYSNENVNEKYQLNELDLLIGMDGNFHMNYWIDNISYLNQRSVRLRAKNISNVSIVQVKYNIAPYIKAKEKRTMGSTVAHLSDKDLKELKILVPKTKKLREILDSTLMKIIKNRKENQELTYLRDFLLPLLMNGQVGFKDE